MLEKFLPRTEFSSYEDFKENYKVIVPENFNFAYDVMDDWAAQCPEDPALHWCNEGGNDRILSFAEIKRLSDKTANALWKMGIRKGDRVMLILMQRIEVWTTMLALQKIGAVAIPVTYLLTAKDIIYRCNCADIRMIISVDMPEVLQHVKYSLDSCSTVEKVCIVGENIEGFIDYRKEIEQASEQWERPTGTAATKATDPMLIYFSSGTTGMPKMILHDFSHPLGQITTARYWQDTHKGDVHMVNADSGWAKFGWGKIYGQWICGATIVAYDVVKFNAKHMLETIERIRPTIFCAPPTVFRFLIREDISHYDLSSIRHCTIAGEPLNPEVFYEFQRKTGLSLTEGFGQSESTVLLANFKWFPIKPGSMGKPAPLYAIDIVDENGESCEDGIVGRVVVRDAVAHPPVGLFKEYYKDEQANAKAWRNGMYDTGDTAWRDADGYYWFVGRSDDVIKCSGYRIGPFEVENALMTHPAVLECAVTAAPDPVRGQVVKATIVLTRQYEPSEDLKKEIQNHVKKVTAPYKYPRIVEFVKELPKTTSGKIRRVEIRSRDHKDSGK